MCPDVAIGFVLSGCIPAGGAGAPAAVLSFLLRGEPALSVALMLCSTALGVLTAPIFLLLFLPYLLDQSYFLTLAPSEDPEFTQTHYEPSEYANRIFRNLALFTALMNFTLCLVLLSALALKHVITKLSEFIENWFLEPVLLFSGIIFTAMGVPINMYIFDYEHYYILGAPITQISVGYLLGMFSSLAACVDSVFARTLTGSLCAINALPAIILLRWVLDPTIFAKGFMVSGSEPDGDMGVIGPAWVLVAYPLPLVVYYSTRGLRKWFVAFVRKRREKQYRYQILPY